MEKKPENYLHLYLGSDVMVESVETDNNATGNSTLKGPFKLIAVGIIDETCHVKLDGYTISPSDVIKPILRPLNNITEEEATESGWMGLFSLDHYAEKRLYKPTAFAYLLLKGFDLLDLIPDGLAIDKTKM